VDSIRLLFAYNDLMGFGIQERKLFVVACKRCRRNVAAGVQEFPFKSIVVSCPLCGERRQYPPSEVFLGRPNQQVAKQVRGDP
jgi:predicted nucleic-acid-binding Zn-ribbon protein